MRSPGTVSRLRIALAWLAVLVLMMLFIATPPAQRTQEARVLETAREMLGHRWHDWLIPQLNSQIRLAKPPLAYWLAAGAFKLGGVSEGVGRVPFVIAGWLTLVVTWAATRWRFGPRAACYAAAALAGTLMFARHARLAETDILATCFVSAAIYAIWRGSERGVRGSFVWLSASGVMIGLATLAKGLPAVFAIVFLLALAAVSLDWRLLLSWLISGAPLLAMAVAAPWFIYVHHTVGLKIIQEEADIGVQGMEHTAPVYQYIPDALRAAAPWTALIILALVLAAPHWRDDAKLRGVLLWLAAVIVPLCLAGQRQFHYLLPAMPPLAVLAGWLIDCAISGLEPHEKLSHSLLNWTAIVGIAVSIGLPVLARQMRGSIAPIDVIVAVTGVVGCGVILRFSKSPQRQCVSFAATGVVLITLVVQVWMPSLRTSDPRTVAAQIRALGEGPYCFYGENLSLPLVFCVGQTMRQIGSPQELSDQIARSPSTIVVAQTKSGRSPPPVPAGLERAVEIRTAEQTFEVYRAAGHVAN
jgi:4-amino-4-deoxy-L-arabinose transferase-like glycosyltransferase